MSLPSPPLPWSPYLDGVEGGGDLGVDAQLLYDGPRPALLHADHQDVREPRTDLRTIKHLAIWPPVLQRINGPQVSHIEETSVGPPEQESGGEGQEDKQIIFVIHVQFGSQSVRLLHCVHIVTSGSSPDF